MKVQWLLVDIETKGILVAGEPFDFFDTFLKEEFERQCKGTGEGIPTGILNTNEPT